MKLLTDPIFSAACANKQTGADTNRKISTSKDYTWHNYEYFSKLGNETLERINRP
jgi:hypothetical protein